MDDYLKALSEAGLTPEQLDLVKACLAHYAVEACMDSKVRDEALSVCRLWQGRPVFSMK